MSLKVELSRFPTGQYLFINKSYVVVQYPQNAVSSQQTTFSHTGLHVCIKTSGLFLEKENLYAHKKGYLDVITGACQSW